MNEFPAPTVPGAPAVPDYKDRSTGLMIFGILTILLGGLVGLFIPMMLISMAAAPATQQEPNGPAFIVPAIIIYGGLAAVLISLGIGSIKARRWARALLLIFSWSWLAMGVFMLLATIFVMPGALDNLPSNGTANQPALPPEAKAVAIVVACLVVGFFFVLMPGAWMFFYSSRHVKATCETHDPVTRWTDACPLPVLGLALWLSVSALMTLLNPLIQKHCVLPFFGTFLTGLPVALFCAVVAALWGYAGWLLYRVKPLGWWLVLFVTVALTLSHILTFAHHNMIEMYQLMGYPPEQIEQIQKIGLFTDGHAMWMALFFFLLMLAYLIFIKKYFRPKP